MKVRTKLTLVLLAITLLPFLIVGRVVYERAENALRESLGRSFERMAAEAIDKVDRSLFEVQQTVETWASLELMQDVVAGDLDGRIASFLIGVKKEYATFSRIDVLDAHAEVIASSDPGIVGARAQADESFTAAVRGRAEIRDVARDDSGDWTVLFCYPIPARFDESNTVGVICARWNAAELARMTRAPDASNRESVPNADTVLVRGDGLVLSTHSAAAGKAFSDNVLAHRWGWATNRALHSGYLVQEVEAGGTYLVGYSRSRGYRDFESLGWSALVLQDVESAFEAVDELEILFLSSATLVAVGVLGLALLIGHRVTRPLVKMAQAAERLASGDFEARIDYWSGDEIGTLASVFDHMVANLKLQRVQLEADIAERKRAELELRRAKEVAEESTAKFSAVLNTMSEGIASIDPEDNLVMVNRQVQRIWGYEESELLGKKIEVLFPQAHVGGERSVYSFHSEGARAPLTHTRVEAEGRRKDGSIFPIELSAARTRIGERNLVTVALRDITERRRAEEQITAALAEKEALLKEIHHRVKNNLQVVVSLLHLQSEHVKDPTSHGIFLDSESRVKSMALMHEKLYRSKDLSSIHVSDYIETLARDLTRSYRLTSSAVSLELRVDDLVLGMDSAIHCGLLVNELVSNALKHAFPGGRTGRVVVELTRVADAHYLLVVRDDGVGLSTQTDGAKTDTLGLQLVHTLAEHLDGRVTVRSGPGTEFQIHFRDVDVEPGS